MFSGKPWHRPGLSRFQAVATAAPSPLLAASQCVIGHMGDSRAYRMRAGSLVQLTHDHTWVQQQVELGRLTALEARTHPLSSVLTHALGASGPAPEPDVVCGDLAVDDLFLLCTDGLSGMIDDADLTALLDQPIPLETIAAQLIDAANLRGGVDNITVVLVRVTE